MININKSINDIDKNLDLYDLNKLKEDERKSWESFLTKIRDRMLTISTHDYTNMFQPQLIARYLINIMEAIMNDFGSSTISSTTRRSIVFVLINELAKQIQVILDRFKLELPYKSSFYYMIDKTGRKSKTEYIPIHIEYNKSYYDNPIEVQNEVYEKFKIIK